MRKNIIGLTAIAVVMGIATFGSSVASAYDGWGGGGRCGWNRCGFNRCCVRIDRCNPCWNNWGWNNGMYGLDGIGGLGW